MTAARGRGNRRRIGAKSCDEVQQTVKRIMTEAIDSQPSFRARIEIGVRRICTSGGFQHGRTKCTLIFMIS